MNNGELKMKAKRSNRLLYKRPEELKRLLVSIIKSSKSK